MSATSNESVVRHVTGVFTGCHHARYVEAEVPIHVISRVFQGRHLLRPCEELNSIIVGVVGRALEHFGEVQLYAAAFLSNHIHLMLQGPPTQVSAFVGFIKREISRRWGHHPGVGWCGPMWHEFIATALPTPESQLNCFRYILSQGVKEGLVARPEEWPGVHCARPLATATPLEGVWFNATAYGRAVDRETRKLRPRAVAKEDYCIKYSLSFAPIPCWAHLNASARQNRVQGLIEEIVAEGSIARAGARPMGTRRICSLPRDRRASLPPPPWWTQRRRMICWASQTAPQTLSFLRRYWSFQFRFREASMADKRQTGYPSGSFAPGRWTELTPPEPERLSA